jgi:23S rRNA-/tRNA-specific pseudouridylate synthase
MIQILAESNFFYVIHKPASLSVHNQLPSVYEYIKTHKLPEHFVNRLDRETSGLMLISQKNRIPHTPQFSTFRSVKNLPSLITRSNQRTICNLE